MSNTKRDQCWEYKGEDFDTNRDKKKWYKPNKSFKRVTKKKEKAKFRHLMDTEQYDNINEYYPKGNEYDWN